MHLLPLLHKGFSDSPSHTSTSPSTPIRSPRSPTMTHPGAGKVWFAFRLCFITWVFYWVGYLAAIAGPRLQTDHSSNIRHRVSRFAKDYMPQLFSNPTDVVLRRLVSSHGVNGTGNDMANFLKEDHARFKYVLIPLTSVNRMPYHKKRFEVCMESILDKASIPLHFFFVVDHESKLYLKDIMRMFEKKFGFQVEVRYNFLDQTAVAEQIAPSVSVVQQIVSGNTEGYYNQSIFFLSVGIHKDILPTFVHQIIMLDTDLKFLSDIKGLFEHFSNFADDNVMGMAYEQQPTYREAFNTYRDKHPKTRVGGPPPKGLPGCNSGVVLLDIDRMKNSKLYNYYLNPIIAGVTAHMYDFNGNLGDQDFYSLIGNEKPNLFYVLPCSWNRHLCRELHERYPKIFDLYFSCDGKIRVYHGSCNSTIPV